MENSAMLSYEEFEQEDTMRTALTKFPEQTSEIFCDDTFHVNFCQSSDKLRQQQILTDVILDVDGKLFPAHRFILATSGDYFMSMFNGPLRSHESCLKINGIRANTMENILHYIYSGTVVLSEENIQELLEASSFLLLEILRERCGKFLRDRLDEENCFQIYTLSKKHALKRLSQQSLEVIAANFKDLTTHIDYMLIPHDVLIDIISYEGLSVPNEDFIFLAILQWYKHEPFERVRYLCEIFKVIHLPFVNHLLLKETLNSDYRMHESHAITQTVNSALEIENADHSCLPNAWNTPRKCHQTVKCTVAQVGTNLTLLLPDMSSWVALAKCSPRHAPGMAVINSRVYIVGGSLNWHRKSCGYCFDIETNTWTKIRDMHTPRSNFGLVELRGKLYALGGYDGNMPLDKVESYDPISDKWTSLAPMNSRRDGACEVSDGECLYAIGGYDGSKYLTSVEFYEPETNQWENKKIPDMSNKRQSAMCAYHEARIYIIGGYHNDHYYSSVEVLDLETLEWSMVAPLPTPRHYAGVSVIKGCIYVCGGWSNQLPVDSVDVYSIENNTWTSCIQLPSPTMARCSEIDLPRKTIVKIMSSYEKKKANS